MEVSLFGKKKNRCYICKRPIGDSKDVLAYQTIDEDGIIVDVEVGKLCAGCGGRLDLQDFLAGFKFNERE